MAFYGLTAHHRKTSLNLSHLLSVPCKDFFFKFWVFCIKIDLKLIFKLCLPSIALIPVIECLLKWHLKGTLIGVNEGEEINILLHFCSKDGGNRAWLSGNGIDMVCHCLLNFFPFNFPGCFTVLKFLNTLIDLIPFLFQAWMMFGQVFVSAEIIYCLDCIIELYCCN